METITERGRRELYEKAEASWGKRTADVLMALLPPVGWGEVATAAGVKDALDASEKRLRGEIALARAEAKAENADLFRKLVLMNVTTSAAICAVAFQIARIAG